MARLVAGQHALQQMAGAARDQGCERLGFAAGHAGKGQWSAHDGLSRRSRGKGLGGVISVSVGNGTVGFVNDAPQRIAL